MLLWRRLALNLYGLELPQLGRWIGQPTIRPLPRHPARCHRAVDRLMRENPQDGFLKQPAEMRATSHFHEGVISAIGNGDFVAFLAMAVRVC